MTKKKSLIITSCVLSCIIVLLIIVGSLFTLQNVDFQLTAMYTTGSSAISPKTRLFADGVSIAEVEHKLYNDAHFKKGTNILFTNFDDQIYNIETKNEYVKVEKIVRHFPNRITVYYSEREPVALLSTSTLDGFYYVVDESLKVLDIVQVDSNEFSLPVLTSPDDSFDVYERGQTINNSTLRQRLQAFVTAAYSVNGDANALYEVVLSEEIFNVQSIEFYTEQYGETNAVDVKCKFVLKTTKGAKITYIVQNITENGAKSNLLEKFKFAISQFKGTAENSIWQQGTADETFEVWYHDGEIRIQ